MLSQFTREGNHLCLADLDFEFPKDVYSVGRLDHDSEGLLLLTNDNYLKTKTLDPENHYKKEYWVQVDGKISKEAIEKLKNGVQLSLNGKLWKTKPAEVIELSNPLLWERNPPIRYRASIPTSWISIKITEGKNRQVRKMTANVGFPTLRLIRVGFGSYIMNSIKPGEIVTVNKKEIYQLLNLK